MMAQIRSGQDGDTHKCRRLLNSLMEVLPKFIVRLKGGKQEY
jgi:hypothetical protein